MPGDLTRRLPALEARHPASGLFAVLVFVYDTCNGGTSVSLCYTDDTEHTTLGGYRACLRQQYRGSEQWIIAGDTEPDEHRCCIHW